MVQHVTIYREENRFAGWPANYGIWNWEDEIVVGFTVGHIDKSGGFHARDSSKPFINQQARSINGGQVWINEYFGGNRPDNRGLSADEHMNPELKLSNLLDLNDHIRYPTQAIRFTHPNFALMCARTGLEKGATSFFYTTTARWTNWNGPYALPDFGQTGIMARTDYIVEGNYSMLLFLTANKANGHEGKVICVRTTDGGQSWSLVSEIGGEPKGEQAFNIMPASLKLDDDRILCAVRCHDGEEDTNWIDLYQSDDNAETWTHIARPVTFGGVRSHGNPPTLNQLSDGRLVMTYGNRVAPFTIEARISPDRGQTWDEPIILRSGGGNHDIGYSRTVVLPDDTLVTVYYFNEEAEAERFIEASIWKTE